MANANTRGLEWVLVDVGSTMLTARSFSHSVFLALEIREFTGLPMKQPVLLQHHTGVAV